MNSITTQQTFHFNVSDVRTALDEKGEPLFCGKDVCAVLEITDHHQALRTLDEDQRGMCNVHTPQGNQDMLFVNESGLYCLIFSSRKPEAKKFRKWVTGEVLPQLRKQGFYGQMPSSEQRLWRKMRVDLFVKIDRIKNPMIKLELLRDAIEVSLALRMPTKEIDEMARKLTGPSLQLA